MSETPMSPERRVREVLSDAASNAVTEHADRIAADVVAAVSSAVDDEVGALRERVDRLLLAFDNGKWLVVELDRELARLRAELAARPTRAEVLRREAGEIVAHCPEHGHRDTYWLDCRCLMAEDILDRVDDPEPGAGPDTPTPLRWGLDDAELGDDNSVTLFLSGPDREPYVLELEPERAAALRSVLDEPKGAGEGRD